ncbi:MAG: hypothetical protein Q7J48_12830 [Nocardioides sp.]|nr:hypothetical protein [Nocardioides sp.]
MSPHLIRRTRLLTTAVVLAAVLTACGSGDDDPGNESAATPEVLTQESADSALLTLDDVGEGFTESTKPDDDDDSDLGCLSGINDLDNLESDTRAEVSFDADGDTALRSILSGVSSFEDTATITDAFDDFRSGVEDCDAVDITDPDGFRITLDVTVDDGDNLGDVDDQIRLTGTGEVSSGPTETYPYALAFVASRIDNNLSMVGLIDFGEPGEDIIDTLTETAVERLNDAIG